MDNIVAINNDIPIISNFYLQNLHVNLQSKSLILNDIELLSLKHNLKR